MASKLYMRAIRGPAAYAAGGFTTTLDEVEYVSQSSSLLCQVQTVTSSPMVAQAVSSSGNIVTVILRDQRSSGMEPASGDFSALGISMTYQGF